jgi:hypothetical protein
MMTVEVASAVAASSLKNRLIRSICPSSYFLFSFLNIIWLVVDGLKSPNRRIAYLLLLAAITSFLCSLRSAQTGRNLGGLMVPRIIGAPLGNSPGGGEKSPAWAASAPCGEKRGPVIEVITHRCEKRSYPDSQNEADEGDKDDHFSAQHAVFLFREKFFPQHGDSPFNPA